MLVLAAFSLERSCKELTRWGKSSLHSLGDRTLPAPLGNLELTAFSELASTDGELNPFEDEDISLRVGGVPGGAWDMGAEGGSNDEAERTP